MMKKLSAVVGSIALAGALLVGGAGTAQADMVCYNNWTASDGHSAGIPCKALDRQLFTLADTAGNTFVVSVSWARMRDRGEVGDLKALIDTDGTGSVAPLGFAVLKSQGVRFTGEPFRSDPKGNFLVVAEAAVASGKPAPALVKAAVEIAVELPGQPS